MTATMTEAHIGHGILTTALEGGIGYWARGYNVKREQLTGPAAMTDFREYTSVDLIEFESAWEEIAPEGAFWLDHEVLDKAVESGHKFEDAELTTVTADAIRTFVNKAVKMDAEIVAKVGARRVASWVIALDEDATYPDLDAEDADVIVQMIALGEIRYG